MSLSKKALIWGLEAEFQTKCGWFKDDYVIQVESASQ